MFSPTLLLPLVTLLSAPTSADTTGCTNTSTFGPLEWREDTNLPCCITKILEPECTEITSEVCVDHVETFCVLATTLECQQTSCPVEVTMPVQESNEFKQWVCEDINVTLTYTAERSVDVEQIATVCDDKWCTGDDGVKVACGKINCVDTVYTKPVIQEYEKEEWVKASDCTQLPPIEYLTCQNMTITQEQLCTACVPRVISECKSLIRQECIESTSKTCKPKTDTQCNFRALEPYQSYTEKRRCGHAGAKVKPTGASGDADEVIALFEDPLEVITLFEDPEDVFGED